MHRRYYCLRVLVGLSMLSFILLQRIPVPSLAAYAPLQHAPKAGVPLLCPSVLVFGLTIQCAVAALNEQNTYPFTAAANDKLKIRVQVIGGALDPAIHVYSSTGEQICTAFTSLVLAEIGNCVLPVAGNYRLVVDDTYRTNIGEYLLYVQRLNNPDNAALLGFSQTLTNSLRFVAEFNTYRIAASAGAKIKMRMTRLDGSFYPQLRLYNQAGGQICAAFSSGPSAEISSCTLPNTGMYTILADDTYTSGTGSYAVDLTCLNEICAFPSIYIPFVMISRS
jgi:hypothetical protein